MNFWITKNFGIGVQQDYVVTPFEKTTISDFWQSSATLNFRFGIQIEIKMVSKIKMMLVQMYSVLLSSTDVLIQMVTEFKIQKITVQK